MTKIERRRFGLWSSALKIAWRDARASAGKFLFVLIAVALGVGALSGVRGFSGAFRDMLLRDARILMAGDLSVRMYHQPDADQQALLDALVAQGARSTHITETVSMLSSEASARPLLVAVKAVDPQVYPFYGQVELQSGRALADALDADTAVATADLLLRLGVEVGGEVRVGQAAFRVGDVITVEPDRMTGSFNVGPRLMMTREGLERSGLILPGSRAAQRFLFRMPDEGLSIEDARESLEQRFRRYWIADYRETHPTIRRGLSRATNFLSLVSLVAMIVGAIGVAMAMYSHLQQRLDTIAVMKCLGAQSNRVLQIYLVQAVGLGLTGSLLGVGIGYGVQAWAPRFVAVYFPTAPDLSWQPIAAGQALLVGLLTTLLFSLPPLLAVRRVRPSLIFRREMAEQRMSLRQRIAASRTSLVAGAAIVAVLGVTATWLGDSLELGAWFAGGLTVSLAALALTAWALLRLLRALPGWLPFRLPTPLRHGLANLHRPGVHAEAILVALGVGVTFTLAVYLIQHSLLRQMAESAPPDMPNVFLLNVTTAERDGLVDFLQDYPGVEGEPDLYPSVPARLLTVNSQPLAELELGDEGRRFRSTRDLTWAAEEPDVLDVIRGSWWSPEETRPLVSVRDDVAETLEVGPGDRLSWLVGSAQVEAEVAAVHRYETIRPGSAAYFVLTPAALEGLPATFYGGVRIAPERAPDLQRDAYELFPTVMVINAADVLRIVQDVVDQIAIVVQFVSAFAIVGGAVVLASSVMASRFRRIRETAILKTLGATRATVAAIFSVEFLTLGLTAGLIGAVIASGFSAALLERVLETSAEFQPIPALIAVVATAILAVIAGWLASFRILGRKPLEVLRHE